MSGFEIVTRRESQSEALQTYRSIIAALRSSGLLRSLARVRTLPDEPPLFAWRAQYTETESAGGASASSDTQALAATLAECLERSLWKSDSSAFVAPRVASLREMHSSPHLSPERFSGFSSAQRAENPRLTYSEDSRFLWIKGENLLTGKAVMVPAQTASAAPHPLQKEREPLIRPRITTGLATGPTRSFALLAGILEIIERDAFMIMWLNQLSYPRIDLNDLKATDEELNSILERCKRFKLEISVVRLLTDAPAHVTCAIVRDSSGSGVDLVIGLGVNRFLSQAAAHAIKEALRLRVHARTSWLKMMDPATIVPRSIHHFERVPYWLHDKRFLKLSFLDSAETETHTRAVWEDDTSDKHLERLLSWCREKKYACVSVDLGRSKKNPTPWFVESVIIPEMQPLYVVEKLPCLGGSRLYDVPHLFGYTPRTPLFTEEPHPFA